MRAKIATAQRTVTHSDSERPEQCSCHRTGDGSGDARPREDQSNFFYSLSNRGKTAIRVERGEIRFSGDLAIIANEAKPFLDQHIPIDSYTVKIPGQLIGPYKKDAPNLRPIATFPGIDTEALKRWKEGRVKRIYLSGDIWYRDAFPDTKLHHKRFGVFYDGLQWYSNPSVANDEIDED